MKKKEDRDPFEDPEFIAEFEKILGSLERQLGKISGLLHEMEVIGTGDLETTVGRIPESSP